MYRSSVKRRILSILLSLIIALVVFPELPPTVMADGVSPSTIVEFNFDSESMQADDGIAELTLVSASFSGWVNGYRPSGNPSSMAPNADKWNNNGASWQIKFSSEGYMNLELSSRQQSSNTGPKSFKIQWSTDGVNWSDVPSGTVTVAKNFTTGVISGLSLPDGCNNQQTVYLRWLRDGNEGVNGADIRADGTNRIDDIIVKGIPSESYTITYDANGGTGDVPAQTKYQGYDITLKGTGSFSRDGYELKNWNTSVDGGGTSYELGASYLLDESLTLYAQWEALNYTITYKPGTFGNFTAFTKDIPFDTSTPDPGPNERPGHPGYQFVKWNPALSPTVAGEATYTALWTLPQSEITFYHIYGGGGNPGSGQNHRGVYDYDFVVLYNHRDQPVDLTGWEIQYASVTGTTWSTHNLQGYACPKSYFVIRAAKGSITTENQDLPFFHWSLPNLAIHKSEFKMALLKPGGTGKTPVDFIGTGKADQYLGSAPAPKMADKGDANEIYENKQSVIRKAYTGDNVQDYKIQFENTTSLNYFFEEQRLELTFDKNGGNTEAVPNKVGVPHGYFNPQNLPQAPKKSGHSFVGWNTLPDGNGDDLNADTEITTCMTLYAQYTPLPIVYHTVTFVDYDGKILTTQSVEKGQSATPPVDPEREGYHFTGWVPAYQNVQSDLTVTAQYQAISELPDSPGVRSHIVSFIDHDGKVLKKETVGHGTSATPPEDPVSEGLIFLRWAGDYQNVTEDRVIRALYEASKYSIVYKDHDGTILYEEQLTHGQAKNPPVPIKRPGFDFVGWNKDLELVLGDDEVIAQYAPRSGENDRYRVLGMLFILLAAGSIGLKKRYVK